MHPRSGSDPLGSEGYLSIGTGNKAGSASPTTPWLVASLVCLCLSVAVTSHAPHHLPTERHHSTPRRSFRSHRRRLPDRRQGFHDGDCANGAGPIEGQGCKVQVVFRNELYGLVDAIPRSFVAPAPSPRSTRSNTARGRSHKAMRRRLHTMANGHSQSESPGERFSAPRSQ
jgi:hypothetical protein